MLVSLVASGADSTISPTAKFAFSANAGWIDFRPDSANGIVFNEYYLSGKAHAANFGWVDFGSGAPANGLRYGNSGSDFGVNHDGLGNLSGYAYSANTGWINFGWSGLTDSDRPRVNLDNGIFSGFAYSANVGWINLGGSNLVTVSMQITDNDGDGIADAWELAHFGNLTTASATSDFDGDGATDLNEYTSATNPRDATSFFKIVTVSYANGFTQATVAFSTDPSRRYRLEISDALGIALDVWSDSGLGAFAPEAGAVTTKNFSWAGSAKKFIRVVATRPLQP
jgi:hypothetical protein